MNLNSDLGESAGFDAEIMAQIDSANVGCGLHAGSATETIATVRRCHEMGVEVGAHPGYDDRPNFGRVEVPLAPAEIGALVRFQVAAIAVLGALGYIKAHGALYHRCQADPEAAEELVRVAHEFETGLMGQPGFPILELAAKHRVPTYRECFADRLYLTDGRLAPRTQPGAVLTTELAADQAIRFARSGEFDTICLHGDSPGAVATARAIRSALRAEGFKTEPLRRRR